MTDADDKTPTSNDAEETPAEEKTPAEIEDEQAPTPFDHPLLLPILLSGLTLWFGYDGWLTTDPEMIEHSTFNRVVFVPLFLAAIYTGVSGYKEWKEDQK